MDTQPKIHTQTVRGQQSSGRLRGQFGIIWPCLPVWGGESCYCGSGSVALLADVIRGAFWVQQCCSATIQKLLAGGCEMSEPDLGAPPPLLPSPWPSDETSRTPQIPAGLSSAFKGIQEGNNYTHAYPISAQRRNYSQMWQPKVIFTSNLIYSTFGIEHSSKNKLVSAIHS